MGVLEVSLIIEEVILFHGTSLAVALALAAKPQVLTVSLGGGELGQGFYAGDHVALAAAWARGRHSPYAVLEIDVDTPSYVALNIKVLNWAQVVNTWNQLRASGATRTHRFGADVVHGPLATLQHATQHKFESPLAEAVLRQSGWRKL